MSNDSQETQVRFGPGMEDRGRPISFILLTPLILMSSYLPYDILPEPEAVGGDVARQPDRKRTYLLG